MKFLLVSLLMLFASVMIPPAYGMICSYVSDGGWTGELVGCETRTYSFEAGYKSVGGSYSVSERVCTYRAHDPYGVGHSGTKTYNAAKVNRC